MISLYTGTPGSGKSLHLASLIRSRLLHSWGYIIGNFEINRRFVRNPDAYVELDNAELTPNRIVDLARNYWSSRGEPIREGRILLVIDECQILFNSRNWQKTSRSGWIEFFTQHRKYGIDVILIAQFDQMVDKQIRSLIEYQYIHRKVSNFGIAGKIMSLLFLGRLHVCVLVWYPIKERISSEFFVARPSLFRLYDTFKVWEDF